MENPVEIIFDKLDEIKREILEVIKKESGKKDSGNDDFMRLEAAADYMGIKVSTLRSYLSKRAITYHKRNTMIYLKKSDMNEYIEQGKIEKSQRIHRSR